MENNYGGKEAAYFGVVRDELVECIPPGPHRVLELGAGDGATGSAIKQSGKAAEVVGVELVEAAAQKAAARIDRVITGDIEKLTLPYPAGYFDYIVCGDVLEHLVDPWKTLVNLRPLLAERGKIIASIPNVRYRHVVVNLLFGGEWKYQNVGVLDRTHLRFFTKKSIARMFHETGYEVERMTPKYKKAEERLVNAITLKTLDDFFAWQYIVVAGKK